MAARSFALLVWSALGLRRAGASGEWAWGAAFSLEAGETYTWSAARGADGEYAELGMKMVVCPASAASEAGVEAAEESAELVWDLPASNWSNATAGSVVELSSASCTAVDLQFSAMSWVTLLHWRPKSTGAFAFFCEHAPSDFENGFHYLKEEHGRDVEPDFVEGAEDEEGSARSNSRLLLAVGGAFLTTLPALLMIGLVGPGLTKLGAKAISRFFPFTSGAIAGCAIFLILPEALHLTAEGQEDEVTGVWTWGTSVLVGWLACVLIHHATNIFTAGPGLTVEGGPAGEGAAEAEDAEAGQEAGSTMEVGEVCGVCEAGITKLGSGVDWAVALPILFGDLLHGLVDGIVIGFSARTCDVSMTWGIIAGTVGHETPQEVSDFIILVFQARMGWKSAALANFLTAQGAPIGALLAYFVDVSSQVRGLCLGFCGGVFLFIALSELAPHTLHLHLSSKPARESLMVLLSFALGAACIGLILLDHEHCGAHAEGGAHDAHGH